MNPPPQPLAIATTLCRQSPALPRRTLLTLIAGLILAITATPQGADSSVASQPQPVRNEKLNDATLRIIVFGAHPDDCEYAVGGTAAMWAAKGHKVKFVSCTNGDIGHWRTAGGPLAQRRADEVKRCASILGIAETEVLDIHDGELMVTMDNRRTICRLIRQWDADVVISHRPNDYHPDHRYVGVLVMDAAYMVTVPFFCPDTPYLTKNPVFLFCEDEFKKPNPFTPDVAVAIDGVIEKKLSAMEALESQFYEGGCNGGPELVPDPKDTAAVAARKKQVREELSVVFAGPANRYRAALESYYGREAAHKTQYAECFEICEYGRLPKPEEVRRLFPFFTPGKP